MIQNILFIAEELEINGAVYSLLALLKALPKDKYRIFLFLFKHGGSMMDELPKEIELIPQLLPYYVHRAPLRQAIAAAVRGFRIDLLLYRILLSLQRLTGLNYNLWSFLPNISGQYDVACCYTDGFVAPVMLRKVNASKKVAWIHLPYSMCAQMPCVYDALKEMDICVPVSIDVGRGLDIALGKQVYKHIVHNIIDADDCKKRAMVSCEIPRKERISRIVSVGRVTSSKCFDIIPSVANLLDIKGFNYEWYIIGNGDKYSELLNETIEKGLDDRVHFIGARSNPMPWIKSADVFVNTSHFEAWGMTVSEALCLGKAVIVSDIPVFAEQVIDRVNGLICKVTPENIANAIELLLTNNELRHKLEQNAIKYQFTQDVVLKEFTELIEKLNENSICR